MVFKLNATCNKAVVSLFVVPSDPLVVGSSELDAGLDPATFEEGEWFYQEANGDVSAPLTWDEMRTLAGDAIILADM